MPCSPSSRPATWAAAPPFLDAEGQPIRSPNITASNLRAWTPAQLAATLRTGQGPHGPVRYPMPKYTRMTDEEVQGIYAHLRTGPDPKTVAAR